MTRSVSEFLAKLRESFSPSPEDEPRTIVLIACHEPRREGEYPIIYGTRSTASCHSIEEEHDERCGMVWFVIRNYSGDIVRRVSALAVAEIHYE